MKSIKVDFRVDIITKEEIPVSEIRRILKDKKNRNYYLSEISDYYYRDKYNRGILDVLSDFYDIPKCPVTGGVVSCKLQGSIFLGKYSSECNSYDMTKHIAENSEGYKSHVKRMKIERKGEGNPMHGKKAWNDGLTKHSDSRVMKISKSRKGIDFSDETLQKMSDSAKVREVHGHTGCKHSEKSKQIMREKTIARFKRGEFPQTNTLPHREVKRVLCDLFGGDKSFFSEEFSYGGFSYDFKVGKTLIEVQGDYFHCNPETRHAIPKNKMQVNNLERDKRKRNFVEKNGEYEFLEVWENDIINNIEKVIICLSNLKK